MFYFKLSGNKNSSNFLESQQVKESELLIEQIIDTETTTFTILGDNLTNICSVLF